MTRRSLRVILDLASVVFAPDPDSWQALAATYETVGRLDATSAVLTAIDLECHLLSGQPGLYAGIAGGGPIIPI